MCGLRSKKCDIKKPKKAVKYTKAFGGRGGRAVNDYCKKGSMINYWRIRSGALPFRRGIRRPPFRQPSIAPPFC